MDVPVIGLVVLALDGEGRIAVLHATSAAAVSSCVESGLEAQSDDVRAASLERPHQVRCLGGDVQAGDAVTPVSGFSFSKR